MSRLLAPVFLVAFVLTASAVLLANCGFAVVHQCVAVPGQWMHAGTGLALVHESPACAPGSLALGPTPAGAVRVLAVVAIPVAIAHLVALATAWVVAGYARGAIERLGRLLAAAVETLHGRITPEAGLVPARPAVRRFAWEHVVRRLLGAATAWVVRGPPTPVCAPA